MFKKATTLMVVSLFVASVGYAQPLRPVQHMKKASKDVVAEPSFYTDYQNAKAQRMKKVGAAPVDMIFANYDWPSNSYTAPMLYTYDFDGDGNENPIAIATNNTPTRYAAFGFIDAQGAYSFPVEGYASGTTPYRTGWNSHLLLDRKTGKAYVALYDFLTSATLYNYIYEVDLKTDPTVAKRLTDIGNYPGGWPRAALTDDGAFWAIDDGFDGLDKNNHWRIMKSSNGGKTFDSVGTMNPKDPNFWGAPDSRSNDPLIMSNGTKLVIFNTLEKFGGLKGYTAADTVTVPSNADGLYYYYSNDMGQTWQGEVVGRDGDRTVANRPGYQMAFISYDVAHYIVDPTGVTHYARIGVNSIGMKGQDTISVYPLYYWNDRDRQWIAISDPATEDDAFVGDDAPGNMLGNSNPTVATSPNGKVVVVTWTVPEYSGEVGNSSLNMYPGDGGANSTPVVHIDLYYAVSTDYGKTFSAPQPLVNTKMESDYWPYVAHPLEVKGDDVVVHYLYYHDPIPGSSVVGSNNSASPEAVWRYNNFTIPSVVAVNDKEAVVEKFALEQNYPNPFNPATMINYSLDKSANVTLKVYDMLGREVVTLVNGVQEAGAHTASFNAQNMTSGLYIYTLSNGVNTISRKMMLLK